MKKFSLLLLSALLSMVFFKPPVSAQSVVKSKAYYDAITYTWTDDGGNTVTSKLTDKATDPYQIIALLEKVYGWSLLQRLWLLGGEWTLLLHLQRGPL